jgi:hypothetical protein
MLGFLFNDSHHYYNHKTAFSLMINPDSYMRAMHAERYKAILLPLLIMYDFIFYYFLEDIDVQISR